MLRLGHIMISPIISLNWKIVFLSLRELPECLITPKRLQNKNVVISLNELQLDNMDKNDVKDAAYYIWLECNHVDDGNVMGRSFYEACRNLAEEQFYHLDWEAIWEEIDCNYLY